MPNDQLLPDRHVAPDPDRRHRDLVAPDPRPGRSRDDADLGPAHRAPHVRAVRDDRLRQQRGRRQARRQRQVDRRPAARRARHRRRAGGGDPARRALGRRLDGRDADRLGDGPVARADDRAQDERRAAAADPRLSGPAHRPRPVRLRLGDEVAQGARADDARGVRRLLGPARLGQGGADPHPVADRHAARRRRAGQVAIAGVAWAPDRGISRVEVAVDGVWRDARLSTPLADATWVQWVTEWAAEPGRTS